MESTVVDCSDVASGVVTILRPGGITREQLLEVVGPCVVEDPGLKNQQEKPKAPGMKYTHYAPRAPVFIVHGDVAALQSEVDEAIKQGKRNVGVIATLETKDLYQRAAHVAVCGSRADLSTVARDLYQALREFDELDTIDVIYSEAFPQENIGSAVMDRLGKAAGHKHIHKKEGDASGETH